MVNSFAADASWNNWQGYLLEPARPRHHVTRPAGRGSWAFANLGVLLALVLAFVGGLAALRRTVRRQESGGNTLRPVVLGRS